MRKIRTNTLFGMLLLFLAFFAGESRAADSVCAVVKIEIKQELTLERQAFDATMRINNGLDTLSLENVAINVTFEDETGAAVEASSDPNNTTASFFIRIDSMTGINDIAGAGVVAPNTTAEIHWLIIPAPGAGGTVPTGKLYFVGASIDYTLGGEPQNTTVTPDSIYVKPLPLLTLDYFLTRDVFADDAFTPAVEPAEPFTLGVRVSNNGSATATNVAIDSAQPRIVENEQGLLIGFTIIGSHVNDQPATNSLLINLGDVEPGRATVGRWDMVTTLSGKFTDFQASFSHADELGGQLTSILDATNAHFLIRNVRVDLPGRDNVLDFLGYPTGGNADNLTVYESDNVDTPVTNQSASATFTPVNSGAVVTHTLTTPVTAGFMYVKLPDPYGGTKEIQQVVRSDGKYILLDNAWTSKTRNLNTSPPSWDYWVNFFDANTTGTYSVVMGPAAAGPSAPVFTPMNNVTTWETNPTRFPVSATDPNGDNVTLTASGLPAGATFTDDGNGSGTFAWTPAVGQAGDHNVTFTATDTGGLSNSQTVTLRVNPVWDTDGDGMDDQWEIAMFGDLSRDGTGDFDGDGISDLQEYLNQSNPTIVTPAAPRLDAVPATTQSAALTVTGTADPDTEVRLFVNGTQQISVTSDASGAFTADLTLVQGINTLHAQAAFSTELSQPSNSLLIQYIPVGASRYYLLTPAEAAGDLTVVSLVDGNLVTAGATRLPLNQNEPGTIPATDLTPGTVIIGSGPFAVSASGAATDMPVPASFASTDFVIPLYRGAHTLHVLSPDGNATVQLTTPDGNVQTVTIPQGQVVAIDAGSDNTAAARLNADIPVLITHTGTSLDPTPVAGDTFPVLPPAVELWGVRSQTAIIAALNDNTSVLVYADDGTSEQITLNAGQQYVVTAGVSAVNGAGSALHLVADKPVAALQVDDGDGMESSTFLDRGHLATTLSLPRAAEYLAVVCPGADTSITVNMIGQPVQTYICTANGQNPGKLLIDTGATGAGLPAGSHLVGSAPIMLQYETADTNAENNLLGNPPHSALPAVAVPYLATPPSQVYDSSLTLTGLTAPSSEVRLYVDNVLQTSTFSAVDGSFSIGATLDPGIRYLQVVTWNGSEESSPSATYPVEYIPPTSIGVDLQVSTISTTVGSADIGTVIPVHFEIVNTGVNDSADTTTGIYLSTDPVITVDDYLISQRWTGSIVAGGSYVVDQDVLIPGKVPPGTYYLGAIADLQSVQPEENESNNSLAGTTLTLTQNADLTVTGLSTTIPVIDLGEPLSIHLEVTNQGASYVGQTKTGVYLSTDSIITPDDYRIGEKWTGGLYPGDVAVYDVSFKVPGSVPPGTYYLGAIADHRNEQTEVDETNNTLAANSVEVIQITDLVPTVLTPAQTTVDLGADLDVHVEITNQGTSYVGASTAEFYLSADPIITRDDYKLSSMWTSGLYAGGVFAKDYIVRIRKTVPPGTYYLGVIADALGEHPEQDETNNALATATMTVIQITDLTVSNITTTQSVVDLGVPFDLHFEVNNLGSSYVGESKTGIYLSTDNVITQNDYRIKTVWMPGIYGNSTVSKDVQIAAGSNIPPGTYYIGAIADDASENDEQDETNNATVGQVLDVIQVVDYQGKAVTTTATTAEWGHPIDLHVEIANNGSSHAYHNTAIVYISKDQTITTDDIPLYSIWLEDIAGGSTFTKDLSIPLKSWKRFVPGDYYLGVLIDHDNALTETDETNNALAGSLLTITQIADMNPVVVSTLDTTASVGQDITVHIEVDNLGTSLVNQFGGTIYLSTDQVIDSNDIPIKSLWFDNINGLERYAADLTFPLDSWKTITPGQYYLGVTVDNQNGIVETDETNNAVSGTLITVQ